MHLKDVKVETVLFEIVIFRCQSTQGNIRKKSLRLIKGIDIKCTSAVGQIDECLLPATVASEAVWGCCQPLH